MKITTLSGRLIVSLSLLFHYGVGTSRALAQTAEELSAPAWPLEHILHADGTIDFEAAPAGSFEASGWLLTSTPTGKPRFLRKPEVSSEAKSGIVGGEGLWDSQFFIAGVGGPVHAILTTTNGLYVGGSFTNAGGILVGNIAFWTGARWESLGGGVDGPVYALTTEGDTVVVGGDFDIAGGVEVNNLAYFDIQNQTWSSAESPTAGPVRALVAQGGRLYAGGEFERGLLVREADEWRVLDTGFNGSVFALVTDQTNVFAGGAFTRHEDVLLNRVAVTADGTNWFPLAGGVDGVVKALAWREGELLVGGRFTRASGIAAQNFALWTNEQWISHPAFISFPLMTEVLSIAVSTNQTMLGGISNPLLSANGFNVVRLVNGVPAPLNQGVSGPAHAVAIWGDEVYIGGNFQRAGGRISPHFARWTQAAAFEGVGSSGLAGRVDAVALNGFGELFVAGDFSSLEGLPARRIARWDGEHWTLLGTGLNGPVYALATRGVELVAGGEFTEAGGIPARNIARWNGSAWSALGNGMNASVLTLAINGDQIYAGGEFTAAGEVQAHYIARWDGDRWNSLGRGFDGPVRALAARGNTLFAGGDFRFSGELPLFRVGRWDGLRWNALGMGVNGPVTSLVFNQFGQLYVGGQFTEAPPVLGANNILRWTGNGWQTLDSGVNGPVRALAYDRGELYVTGAFNRAGSETVGGFARWREEDSGWESVLSPGAEEASGNLLALAVSRTHVFVGGIFNTLSVSNLARVPRAGWSVLGQGIAGAVQAVAVDGDLLYVGGTFNHAGGASATNVAQWDGRGWTALGGGVNGTVRALLVTPNRELIIGGDFKRVDGLNAFHIAQWNGSSWAALGIGLDGPVHALTMWGGNLIAGGAFTRAGGFSAEGVAYWDGVQWKPFGKGIDGTVQALAVHEGNLYAGGSFTNQLPLPVRNLARWEATTTNWLSVAGGTDGAVHALASAADGLYVGGNFTYAGGFSIPLLARFNGNRWSSPANGVRLAQQGVKALQVATDGSLYVTGDFVLANGLVAEGIARWDGIRWSVFTGGIEGVGNGLAVTGRDVWVVGAFTRAGIAPVANISRWQFQNILPSATVMQPLPGATFTRPVSILIQADAADADGQVRQVEFFANNTFLGQSDDPPFVLVWQDAPVGTHLLTVRVTDDGGSQTRSGSVVVEVQPGPPPLVQLTSPAPQQRFAVNSTIRLQAGLQNFTQPIERVEFYANDILLGIATSSPFEFDWVRPRSGDYQLSARAYDTLAHSAVASRVPVTIFVPSPAQLSGAELTPDRKLRFRVPDAVGRTLTLQSSTNLTDWSEVSTQLVTSDSWFVELSLSAETPVKFYRVIEQ